LFIRGLHIDVDMNRALITVFVNQYGSRWVGPLTVCATTLAVIVVRFVAVAVLKPPPTYAPLAFTAATR